MPAIFEMELAYSLYEDVQNQNGNWPRYFKYQKEDLVYITNTYYVVRISKEAYQMFLELFDDKPELEQIPERSVDGTINKLWEDIPEKEAEKSPLEWNGSKVYQIEGEIGLIDKKFSWLYSPNIIYGHINATAEKVQEPIYFHYKGREEKDYLSPYAVLMPRKTEGLEKEIKEEISELGLIESFEVPF